MYQVALFDLDGVVFNTEPLYTQFWGDIFCKYAPEQPDLALCIKGQTLVQIFDKYFREMEKVQMEIIQAIDAFEYSMPFDYIRGFETFILDLKRRGIRCAVVTSSNRMKMENVYRKHPEFKEMFAHILTAEDFTKSKPDPEGYLKGAGCFSVAPSECIGFEDSFNGLKAVRAAKMTVVGLATTNTERDIASLSDVVISDYTNLDFEKLSRLLPCSH